MSFGAWRAGLFPLLVAMLLSSPAGAADEIALDAARRSALAGLPVLRGSAIEAHGLARRVVVLGFFASWCPPCGPEFDTFNRLHAEFADDGVTVLAVNIFESYLPDADGARLAGFLDRKAPDFRVGDTINEPAVKTLDDARGEVILIKYWGIK